MKLETTAGRAPRYTGKIVRNTGASQAKEFIALRYSNRIVIAAGDSVADLPLLRRATLLRLVVDGNPDVLAGLPADGRTIILSSAMGKDEVSKFCETVSRSLSTLRSVSKSRPPKGGGGLEPVA